MTRRPSRGDRMAAYGRQGRPAHGARRRHVDAPAAPPL